ncbi:hypothetical protein NDU88_005105 [Pleurodeles waltl]|uniref:Uncharacterized protein n=1 Tax=Pleurodeles waltl TaxID=8319 RepID=A0AAV7V4Z6_PLEWA|nr:hypothetical protein NDU88_005105 [Pleurodeles waltl]
MTVAQIGQDDASTPHELEAPSSLNPDALPFTVPTVIRLRDSLEDCDLYYDCTAVPAGVFPDRRNSGSCLEFVDLFPDDRVKPTHKQIKAASSLLRYSRAESSFF